MTRLALYLLGPPRVELDGEQVQIGRRKAVALLAYLAVTGRDHSRDTLATLLWPDYDHRGARGRLRRTLSTLSRTLGGAWLTADREIVSLSPDADLWLDVGQFRQRLADCEAHGHPVREVCPECLPPLQEAVALYRDDFMSGFTLPDNLSFDEWQLFQTQELRGELASALERLVSGHRSQEAYEAAVPYARRWAALDPLHEPTHRHLMALYAYTGQASAALHQYELCERTLAQELGVRPAEETTALYERIRSGLEALPERQAPAPTPHNLPRQPTPFVGREVELAHIARRLDDPACRLLTLVGPGGIGKTRLAIAAAERQLIDPLRGRTDERTDLFPHGCYFVPLVGVGAADALAPSIASALDFSFLTGAQPQQQLLDYLRGKTMLLVLDNFAHLLSSRVSPPEGETEGGVDFVTEILAAAPGIKILVTSREALNIQGEWFHPVEGMGYPPRDAVEAEEPAVSLRDHDAVELFVQCARRSRPGFSFEEAWRPVMRICQLVEGMPLAIELAAAWLRVLSPIKIAEELERGLDILSTSMRDLPARHRSMRAVFDHSWRLLSEVERGALQCLSVFRGGFRLEAAEAVAGASLPLLAGLVDKSLLSTTPAGRYQMHGLLRQYAAEKLQESPGEREAAHSRHSAFLAAFLQERGEALKGTRQQMALAEIEVEIENARAAWNWAVEGGQVALLDQAIDGLFRFYERRGRFREGEAACRLAGEKLAPTVERPRLVLAKVCAWQGVFCRLQGRTEDASQLLAKSLALLEGPESAGHDARPERAFILLQTGRALEHTDREQTRQLCEQSLALYRELGDRWGEANVLNVLGGIFWILGNYDEGKHLREESLVIRRALGDKSGIADSLMQLGWGAVLQSQSEECESLLQESLAISREMGDRASIAEGLVHLGAARFWLGKFAEAHAVLEESVAVNTKLGFRTPLAWSKLMLGLTMAHQGQYKGMRAWAQNSLALNKQADIQAGIGHSLLALGHMALAEEAHAEAQSFLQEAVAVYQEIGQKDELCWALADLGTATRALGDLHQAGRYLYEAVRMAAETTGVFPHLVVVPAAAQLLADAGQSDPSRKERAVELYALASRYPYVANSHWFEDVIGKHIAAVAATLPPEVVAAAQERGRGRNLDATMVELLAELEEE